MMDLEPLRAIHFHDLPLEYLKLWLDDPMEIEIGFKIYDEVQEDYARWSLRFKNVLGLNSGEFSFDGSSSFEIFSFKYSADELLHGELTYLTGFGRPSLTMVFVCRSYAISRVDPAAGPN